MRIHKSEDGRIYLDLTKREVGFLRGALNRAADWEASLADAYGANRPGPKCHEVRDALHLENRYRKFNQKLWGIL